MEREGRPAPDRAADQFAQEQAVALRRRVLEQQLPAAAFPAGSGKPSVVYLWATMFLAAVTVLVFAVNNQTAVPPAVIDSQRDNVSKLASSIELATQHSAGNLGRMVAGRSAAPPPDPEFLQQVVADATTWSGAAIVETSSRRPLAIHGQVPPFELLPPVLPVNATFPITTDDGLWLIRSAGLDASRTLLAVQPLTLGNLRLNPDARQGIFVLTPDGRATLMQGVNAVDERHLPAIFGGLAQTKASTSQPIKVTEWPGQQLVVASAPVGDTGVAVASLLVADVSGGTSTGRGILLGLSLLAMAVPGYLLMRTALVRPVRTLLDHAKADACGAAPPKRGPLRVAEAYRIARALAVTSVRTPPPPLPRKRWRPTVTQGLIVATVAALLWPAAAVAATLRAPEPSIPAQLVRDEEGRADAASNALGRGLDNGLQMVVRISDSVDPADPARMTPLLEREWAGEGRFRSLYLADPSGSVVGSAGREPLRATQPLPGDIGIEMDDSNWRVPVVYAFRVSPKGLAVVGEFDLDYLMRVMRKVGLMDRVDGRVRVVDEDMRTVLDSQGFRAFEVVQGAARDAALEALSVGAVGQTITSQGSHALIGAAGLSKPGSVAHLKWSVVVEPALPALRLPQSVERRWTLLVAGVVVGIVLLTQVWQFYIFAGPLRRLADAADKIGNGSFDAPIPPERHDDIGALAMCVEVCRQVRHTGSECLGGANRLQCGNEERVGVPDIPQPGTERSPGERGDHRPAD